TARRRGGGGAGRDRRGARQRRRVRPRRGAAGPRGDRPGGDRPAVTLGRSEAETFERCIGVGGVALFPADTVYGLACEPEIDDAVARLYALKGRRPDKPAAVMFFQLELALAALPGL